MTYDRASYGSSQEGLMPRDSRRKAEELNLMLAVMDVHPPYIVAGHFLDGLNAPL